MVQEGEREREREEEIMFGQVVCAFLHRETPNKAPNHFTHRVKLNHLIRRIMQQLNSLWFSFANVKLKARPYIGYYRTPSFMRRRLISSR
jgi:hypothetical protein